MHSIQRFSRGSSGLYLALTILAVTFLLAPAILRAEDFTAWSRHRELKLNTTASGANILTPLANYPVPVQLSAKNFDFDQAKPDGSDLRFSKPDGSPLPYEIELWDKAGKMAALWVKSDVAPNSASQSIQMHWGNPAAAASSDSKAVFAPAEGWVAAWHLGEDAASTKDGFKDATGVNPATGHNLLAGSAKPGRVGLGTDLDYKKSQGVKVVDTRKNFDLTANITFEMWAFVRSWANNKDHETFMCKGDASWRYMREGTGKSVEICSDGMAPACVFGKTEIKFGNWFHFAGVHEGRAVRLYVNGKREDAANAQADHQSTGDYAVTLGFSLHQGQQQRFTDILMDEARISKLSKTDDWIKLDFESQKDGSTFVMHGETTTALQRRTLPGWIGPARARDGAELGGGVRGIDAAGRFYPAQRGVKEWTVIR
jgi:hypothetical protein